MNQITQKTSFKKSMHLLSCILCAAFATPVVAEAPQADVGTFNSNVEYGIIFNGGMAIGGDAALELSLGTVHGDSSVDSFTANINQGDGLSLGLGSFNADMTGVIINTGLVIGGDMCAKTAVASVGASTCSYGTGTFSAESATN